MTTDHRAFALSTDTNAVRALRGVTTRWWVVAVLGFLVALLGVLLLADIAVAVESLALLVAIGLLVDGVAEIATAGRHRTPWPSYVVGVVWVVVGVLALVWPGLTVLALAVFTGLGLAVGGVVQVGAGIAGRRVVPMWGLWVALGVVTFVVGVLALVLPGLTVLALGLFLGTALLLRGIAMVWVAFALRRVHTAASSRG
ncbi:HdeD family acid-resistance protein [Actinokineospora pegani]|uniref:HdeD family acid-resistance protein n=1 Tax=Actinokineospora pegani TaxID=2654637 RepID=UPI0018D37D87|nr:DUF308 domain-containing protein [Actinokineospora pegani]